MVAIAAAGVRAEITLHAWISPEEAAVYLVQGHGDRNVDRRGLRCRGHMDADHGNAVRGVGTT